MTRPRYSKLIVAPIVAAVLACALCPAIAIAAPKTVTVHVIKSTTETSDFFGHNTKATTKFTYNKKGLLKKRAYTSDSYKYTNTYSYNGTALKKAKHVASDAKFEVAYTSNKKGRFTKAVVVRTLSDGGKETQTYTAKYKSGKVKKLTKKSAYVAKGDTSTSTTESTYTYAYKKKRVVSRALDGNKATFSYDKNGNLDVSTNTYNAKKRLKRQTQTTPGTKWEVSYKYKAIKVKASVAGKVKAQQWAIINSNLNFALGVEAMIESL